MKEEIKEILDYLKTMLRENEPDIELSREEVKLLLDYITNLQEQLHQASLDIQELTEKDIGCPSWCDKLTNLQEKCENYRKLKERYQIEKELYKQRNEKAIDKIQYIIDYGFDYDGFNTVESLKGLIDLLVDYARQSKDILKGDKDE